MKFVVTIFCLPLLLNLGETYDVMKELYDTAEYIYTSGMDTISTSLVLKATEWNFYKGVCGINTKTSSEDMEYFNNYVLNGEMIKRHNDVAKTGAISYFLGTNRYAIMPQAKLTSVRNNELPSSTSGQQEYVPSGKAPEAVFDWRQKNMVTPVEDQGLCASGWAFAIASSTASLNAIKSGGQLQALSAQSLIDCSKNMNSQGCKGGDVGAALNYIAVNGLPTLENYTYTGQDGVCDTTKPRTKCQIANVMSIPSNNEELLRSAVNQAPVICTINGNLYTFNFYKSGVYNDSQCNNSTLNHVVTVVGYGITPQNVSYWIIQNSWGTTWGENGFMRMIMYKNMCGISSQCYVLT